jgi:hypothetical protein
MKFAQANREYLTQCSLSTVLFWCDLSSEFGRGMLPKLSECGTFSTAGSIRFAARLLTVVATYQVATVRRMHTSCHVRVTGCTAVAMTTRRRSRDALCCSCPPKVLRGSRLGGARRSVAISGDRQVEYGRDAMKRMRFLTESAE